jgi:hypothetical protein
MFLIFWNGHNFFENKYMRRWATNIPFASLSDPNLHPVLDLDLKVTSNPHPVDLDPKLTSKPIRIRKNRIGSSKWFAEAISLPTALTA